MSELQDLYQDLILDHAKRPRNFRKLEAACRVGEGFNPVCGDRVTVYLKVEGDVVTDISFQGSGCAISTASASMMTDLLKLKTLPEVEGLFQRFLGLVTGQIKVNGVDTALEDGPEVDRLEVFAGVSQFPSRVKCASLAWHSLHSALQGAKAPVMTE